MNRMARFAIVALASLLCSTVGTWGAQTPIPLQRDSIRALDWHPDGALLARAFQNGTVEVVDTTTTPESVVFTFSNGIAPASAVRWSHSGDKLAAGIGSDVHIWDLNDVYQRMILTGHTAPILSLTWRADDLELASLSETANGNLRFWDLMTETQRLVTSVDQTYAIDWRNAGTDDFVVAVAGIQFRRINPSTGDVQALDPEGGLVPSLMVSIEWNSSSAWVAAGGLLGDVVVFDSEGILVNFFESTEFVSVNTLSWSPDSQYIAFGDEAGIVRVWSPVSGQVVEVIDTGEDAIFAVDWNPVTNAIAYGGVSGTAGIFVPDLPVIEDAAAPLPVP